MNVEEFQQNYYEDGEVFSDVEGVSFKCVERGDDIVDMKMVFNTSVYQLATSNGLTDEYFEVTEIRSNNGYWSDSERYDPEFRKVKPVTKTVVVTTWESV